jgi:ABC-type glycerol-3-phosphate transport system permease component
MLKIILAIALIIFLLAIGPFLVIWSWNTLFGAALLISYTLETWAAVVLLGAFLRANVTVKR